MERHVPLRCALVLFAATNASPALAEQPTDMADARAFDLAIIPSLAVVNAAGAAAIHRSQAVGQIATIKREKIKLRVRYQPDPDGPCFEIGTIGSRKGAMKSRLLHIAMDLFF